MMSVLVALSMASALAWQSAAEREIRTEKPVVEAQFTGLNSLWVSVRDDGSKRDGFADYLCLIVKESGMPAGATVVIRVKDRANLENDLGRSVCSR